MSIYGKVTSNQIDVSKNNIICIPRGDTGELVLNLNKGTDLNPEQYILQENEEIYFGVMEPNQPFEKAIIKKKMSIENLNEDDNIIIRINHDDTKCILPGKYYYQIKAKFIDNEIYNIKTVVGMTKFFIEE